MGNQCNTCCCEQRYELPVHLLANSHSISKISQTPLSRDVDHSVSSISDLSDEEDDGKLVQVNRRGEKKEDDRNFTTHVSEEPEPEQELP